MAGDQGWPKLLTSSYKLDQFGELKGKKNPFLISFFFFLFFFFSDTSGWDLALCLCQSELGLRTGSDASKERQVGGNLP